MPLKDNLRDLELTGFAKIADKVFASVIAKLPSLRKLNLRHGRFIQSSFYPSLKMELVEAVPRSVPIQQLQWQTIARSSRL